MSNFNPDHQKDTWSAEAHNPSGEAYLHIDLRAFTLQLWAMLAALWTTKGFIGLMMGASFSVINPILTDVYLSEFIPLPEAMENITMGAVINAGLGLATVILPTVLWGHVLSEEFKANPKGYFQNQPIRIAVGAVLGFAYLMLVLLEILALQARVGSSLDTGPIQTIGHQPQIIPMIVASTTLILGTFLIGLASASLSKSITQRYGKPVFHH